jgi:histidinol-phosphate aminotransferase
MDAARKSGAALVYLANPDNPMGTWLEADEVQAAIATVPDGSLLVLDEAYIDCAPQSAVPTLDPTDPRVIRFRTFSKAYGMAGARVGYAIGHAEIIQAFNKVRNHFGMARISQAGALAALADQQYLQETLSRIANSRAAIADIAQANGLVPLPSATNFVTIDCGADGGFARSVLNELIARDIFVRMPFVAPQDRAIRISCGRPEDLDLLAKALPEALAIARR